MLSTETPRRRSGRTLALVALVSGALTLALTPGVASASTAPAAPAVASQASVVSVRDGASPEQAIAPAKKLKKKKRKKAVRAANSPYKFASYRFNKWYAKRLQAVKYGWKRVQFRCLAVMWGKESAWNEKAHNPNGGAHGIPQAQPGSKMASAGPDWQTNPMTQIKWGLGYIKAVYKTPCRAWGFWQAHHWY